MTIEAMKQSLEALKECNSYLGSPDLDEPIATLSQAIEQAEKQEPVAWMVWLHGPAGLLEHKQLAELEFERRNKEYPDENRKLLPLYTTPQAQRERVIFPTMLRKMWSGGEVQAWLDENVNKEKNT